MEFSVIYSIDVPAGTSVKEYLPPCRRAWQQTEGDEQYDYDYLEGAWAKGKHRKFCAMLTRKQFDRFVEKLDLHADSTQTMGSIGSPCNPLGWAPAINFNSRYGDAILSCYVIPVPSFSPEKRGGDESWQLRAWERIREAVLSVYR